MTSRPFDITASGGVTETVSVKIETTDASLDPDGTIAMPVLDFKILISSPDVASNPSGTNNPVELFLAISVRNPCRDANFVAQTVPNINSIVDDGPVSDTLSAFAHNLDSSAYNCGN